MEHIKVILEHHTLWITSLDKLKIGGILAPRGKRAGRNSKPINIAWSADKLPALSFLQRSAIKKRKAII